MPKKKKKAKAQAQPPMMPPPLDESPINLGVDAVSQPDPMVKTDAQIGTLGVGPEEMSEQDSILNRSIAPPGLERFHNQQTQPDREPILNALMMLTGAAGNMLPKSRLAPAEQAPGLWQRPPIGELPPPRGLIQRQPETMSMRPPEMPGMGQPGMQPGLEPTAIQPPTEFMQPPMQAPSMMQQGNSSMLQQFNNMTPEQQLQVLASALGLGIGGGMGGGYGYDLRSNQMEQQQKPIMIPPIPQPKAIQR